MQRRTLRSSLLLLLAAILWLAPAAPALAQGKGGREFNGTIVRAGPDAMRVENRMGDRKRFHRTEKTAIEGKPDWKSLAPGDRVIVQYKVGEEHNRATRVIVLHGGKE